MADDSQITDVWHYPREQLASSVIDMFDNDLSNALLFFAPMNMGKTEFLLRDVLPRAEAKGWHVLYYSFFAISSGIEDSLTTYLANSAYDEQWRSFRSVLQLLFQRFMISKLGVDLSDIKQTLQDIIIELIKRKDKVVILLDEAQYLGATAEETDFLAALRSVLEINKDNVKVVFAGSPGPDLDSIFINEGAPFVNFCQTFNFPHLERPFVDHLATTLFQQTKRAVDTDQLWDIFVAMDKVPHLLRDLIELLVLNPDLSLDEVNNRMLADLKQDSQYSIAWHNLSQLQQGVLASIVNGNSKLLSRSGRSEVAKNADAASVQAKNIEVALQVLANKNIIAVQGSGGNATMVDSAFSAWINRSILKNSD